MDKVIRREKEKKEKERKKKYLFIVFDCTGLFGCWGTTFLLLEAAGNELFSVLGGITGLRED